MRLPGGALTRKSIADVTHRRLRTILVVLGIAVGVLGLTAINTASDAMNGALTFSENRSSSPDLSFSVQAVDSSLAPTLAAVPNVKAVQIDTLSRAGLSPNIETNQQIVVRNQNQFQVLTAILYGVSVIVALVGILGLFNTLTISVLERRREIGILRSMGGTGWRIARVFWTEGISLALLAWVAAVILGIPAAFAFVSFIDTVLAPLPFTFAPVTLGMMLVFILVIATLASFGPALSSARVRVSDMLRYD